MMQGVQNSFERYEYKYLLTEEQYQIMRQGMAGTMRPEAHPRYSISNIYYDTEQYELIRHSLEKPVYKEKLRMRSYGVPGIEDNVFVEIKKKFDGVVYKRRIMMPLKDAQAYLKGTGPGDGSQISREIDYFLSLYQPVPKVFIAYEREAFEAADGGELRITFDRKLRARSYGLNLQLGDYGLPLLPEELYLMEIKIPGAAPLWLARLLSENCIFPTSYSKYGSYYKQLLAGTQGTAKSREVILSA